MTKQADPTAPLLARTLSEALDETVRRHGDRVAVRTPDDSVRMTWRTVRERAHAIAGGLTRLGVQRGESVALMLGNRPEFHLVDLGVMVAGATPFSIYQTLSPEQIQYVVSDAGARVVILERAYLDSFMQARKSLPDVEHVIVVDGEGEQGTLRLADLEQPNPDFDSEASARAIRPEDLVTLIYTSGTTGPPKGVQLSHRNLLSTVAGLNEVLPLPEHGRVISWLPSAHIAERAAHHYFPIAFGLTITCCPDPRQIIAFLPQVRPHFFFAVPRIWEKLKAGLEAQLASLPDDRRSGAQEALAAGLEKVRLEQADQPVSTDLARRVADADTALFSGLRTMLGLDEAELVVVGAAPTPLEVLEFFHAIGIPLSEIWGMSETTGIATANPPERIKLGTVGVAAPGVEIQIAGDGEVMVRGDRMMVGYRNQPEKTAETLDAQGWLHTGDIGNLDSEGYLKIVDRKKEIIINAAGKNMSPSNIEGTLKGASPMVGQACVIGDGRPYNTALIVLDADFAPTWAAQHGLEGKALEVLSKEPSVIAAVQEGVDAANARLARVEQIKKFHLVTGDWPAGGDELTPTMKLKRKPIAAKYAAEIEALYSR